MDPVSRLVSQCFKILTRLLDGMYGNFAGRDASRGMAKQSFDSGMNHPSM